MIRPQDVSFFFKVLLVMLERWYSSPGRERRGWREARPRLEESTDVLECMQATMPTDPLPHPSASAHHPIQPTARNSTNSNNSPMPFPSNPPVSPTTTATTPPKAGLLKSTRQVSAGGPKDTIPLAKTIRKQRPSSVHATEHVDLERLPGFSGSF